MKLTVPNSLADISVKQYKELTDLNIDKHENKWLVEAVCILCNLERSLVEQLTVDELSRINAIVAKITDEEQNNQELQKKIEYKGKKYGFHPNLSKLTVGEFADLETYCGNGFFDNLNEIISILYRPIKTEGGDFYTIENYTGEIFPNYWDELKMDVVMGAVNFFLSTGESLTRGLANSLTAEQVKTL
jgi:hypothetical protein